MMSRLACIMLLAFCPIAASMEQRETLSSRANPIRKVVTMLQSMVKQITKEGEVEKKLFDKFMCYCEKGDAALAKSIADAETKMPELASDIEAAEEEVKQLKLDLTKANA